MGFETDLKNADIHSVLLYMMHTAFIEIRATDSLNAAKKIADIFHHVPLSLLKSGDPAEQRMILDNIMDKAARYGMNGYMNELIELSSRAITVCEYSVKE